ncbi:hypothetical protein MVEN_00650400 [Mycena venus]|uniref:Uncharacterized protein n=1 Tax=Mycena venus TaxID=2733690 RepID=A0A8H6YKQ5_9AGAR|nr:hypothetical protein MVEN_00650400 [Mycena venus]
MSPTGNPPGRPRGTRCQRDRWAEEQRESTYKQAKEVHAPGGNYATVAAVHEVPVSSLWHRDHGRQGRREGHEKQKKVKTAEEEEIVKLLRELDSWGLSPSPAKCTRKRQTSPPPYNTRSTKRHRRV